LNFEPQIHYVVEQEATTQGIKMSRGVELVIVTKQEIIILPKVEPTIT
jgi:GTP cyclohydrolase FolE2